MTWRIRELMTARTEFVREHGREGLSFAELCRRHGISRKTGYKWLARHVAEGAAGLVDRSRKPLSSPQRLATEWEQRVIAIRAAHPCWGGRKIRQEIGRAHV